MDGDVRNGFSITPQAGVHFGKRLIIGLQTNSQNIQIGGIDRGDLCHEASLHFNDAPGKAPCPAVG